MRDFFSLNMATLDAALDTLWYSCIDRLHSLVRRDSEKLYTAGEPHFSPDNKLRTLIEWAKASNTRTNAMRMYLRGALPVSPYQLHFAHGDNFVQTLRHCASCLELTPEERATTAAWLESDHPYSTLSSCLHWARGHSRRRQCLDHWIASRH